jgi:hypothetical protein
MKRGPRHGVKPELDTSRVMALRKSAGMVDRLHLDDRGLEVGLLSAVLPPSVAEKIPKAHLSPVSHWNTYIRTTLRAS